MSCKWCGLPECQAGEPLGWREMIGDIGGVIVLIAASMAATWMLMHSVP